MHHVQQPTSASKREGWTRLDVRPATPPLPVDPFLSFLPPSPPAIQDACNCCPCLPQAPPSPHRRPPIFRLLNMRGLASAKPQAAFAPVLPPLTRLRLGSPCSPPRPRYGLHPHCPLMYLVVVLVEWWRVRSTYVGTCGSLRRRNIDGYYPWKERT
ncbi:hypothetical protein B0H14DRAFT_317353 [Mycena olivaceomarginata]|nr:hypothetical protein B0H14DRAFT_317353 [Mycena olivaceomarginata]